MAKQPVATTPTKPAKAEAAPAKPEAAKTETATAETKTETSAAKTEAPAAGGAKKAVAPARPISYFSAVASEDYRAGWDGIFGAKKKAARGRAAKNGAAADNALPLTLTLDAEDIDAATRKRLDAVLRGEAKKRRLDYDKLARNGQVKWHITCRISGG